MAKLPRHLLERAPEETARRLSMSLLDEASSALERMDDPDDSEALHDFRVSLRRLRSLMRAYRAHLAGTGAKKLRGHVKALASSTNVARDTEVQIDWLRTMGPKLGQPGASGADHLTALLAARHPEAPSADKLRREFRPLRRDITKAFTRLKLLDEPRASNFVSATAAIIREHATSLRRSLAEAHSAEDADVLHDARIEAKRLRYILEPLQPEMKRARPLIKRMKSLQDLLGELQDTRVMTEQISTALESSAIDEARKLRDLALTEAELPEAYPPQNPGLLALLKIQRTRRDRAFTKLATSWMGDAANAYFALVEHFVEELARWPGGALPVRRFRLAQVPVELKRRKSRLIRTGWLPGKEIREYVQATRDGRTVRYERFIDGAGNGAPKRSEQLTRRTFAEFWNMTAGRQLEYRAYELEGDTRAWRILSFPALALVLAEVEGSTDSTNLVLPEPVERELVRDVTGVKKYEPEALARATA